MSFVPKMAWRDSRTSRGRLFLFSLSIIFGIAALVALGSFSSGLRRIVRTQAKTLLGADLVVTSRAPLPPEVKHVLADLGGESAEEVSFSSMMVVPSAANATRLVRVRAMEGNFPFYGDFVTAPAEAAAQLRQPSRARPPNPVILEDTLMAQFGLKTGDTVKLGRSTFTIIGSLKKISGESLAISLLAPRALVPLETLAATGLSGSHSLISYRVALTLAAGSDPDAVALDLKKRFSDDRFSVDTVAKRERELGRMMDNVSAFLNLVGFVSLILGAIGVASAIHVYLQQKASTVAVLRCLGASAGQSFGVYFLQGCALGGCGALLGGGLGVAAQLVLPALLRGLLPFPLELSIAWGAVARGMAAGWGICILFALLPFLSVRRISPLGALRASAAEPADPPRTGVVIIGAVTAAAAAALAVWQTRSAHLGLGFTGALGLCLCLLTGLARLTAWAARCWTGRGLPYVLRQGVANLHRPRNRTALLILSLGLGTFLILTLMLTRVSLLREIEGADSGHRSNLLFFDIQDDQVGPLDRLLADRHAPALEQAAIVTMTISSVKDRPVEAWLRGSAGPAAWTLRREYRSTFRGQLTDTERIVAGKFIGRVAAGASVVPISVEQGLAEDMQVGLGDEITWNVQGVLLRTRIASLRSVEWRRVEPNFFVVFPQGALEDAPKSYVAAVRTADPAQSADLQRAVVSAFPNVTAIDLTLILQTLDGIFSKVEFAIDFTALFTVATGLIVLGCAVLNGRHQRRRETVLLRTLGASRRQLASIQLAEYAILGFLGALVGAILALGASALLEREVFHTPIVLSPLALLAVTGIMSFLTVVTGWVADRTGLARPPLELLRAESMG